MLEHLTRNWWAFVLRGIAAILFGIAALLWPGLTLITLVLLFGAYAIVDGIFAIVVGFSSRSTSDRWWTLLVQGILGIIFGGLTFAAPAITGIALLYLIAAWAFVNGVLEIVAAVRLRELIDNEWWMVISGIAAILFGILLFLFPGTGALSLLWVIAIFALLHGVLLIILAFRLRGMRSQV